MSEELKPRECPFCEHNYVKINGRVMTGLASMRNTVSKYYAYCPKCHAKGPIKETEDEAAAAWNRRVEPDGLPNWLIRRIQEKITDLKIKMDENPLAIFLNGGEKHVEDIIWFLNWVLSLKRGDGE